MLLTGFRCGIFAKSLASVQWFVSPTCQRTPMRALDSCHAIMESHCIHNNTKAVTFVGFDAFVHKYSTQPPNGLTNACTRSHILMLPPEIRAEIYRHLLPFSTCSETNGIRDVVWYSGEATIMRTCRLIYQETYHLLYGLNDFEFTWMLS